MIFLRVVSLSLTHLVRTFFKLTLFICVLLVVTYTSEVGARRHSWGLGLMAGWPGGLSIQVPLSRQNALNGSLYYDLRDPSIDLHLDHIVHAKYPYLTYFYPYIGWGGYLEIVAPSDRGSHQSRHQQQGNLDLSARLPLGVGIGKHHWRGFIEISPSLLFLPALQLRIGGSIGIRYHF